MDETLAPIRLQAKHVFAVGFALAGAVVLTLIGAYYEPLIYPGAFATMLAFGFAGEASALSQFLANAFAAIVNISFWTGVISVVMLAARAREDESDQSV